jgi:hypothetical protein
LFLTTGEVAAAFVDGSVEAAFGLDEVLGVGEAETLLQTLVGAVEVLVAVFEVVAEGAAEEVGVLGDVGYHLLDVFEGEFVDVGAVDEYFS